MGSGRPSPDPGLGTAVELTGGEVSGGLNLRMIRETLAGEGIPPEEAPPAFVEAEDRRSRRWLGVERDDPRPFGTNSGSVLSAQLRGCRQRIPSFKRMRRI